MEKEENLKPKAQNEGKGRFLPFTFGAYLIFWVILALKPVDRHDWALENLLIFISTIVLAGTYQRFRFSTLSYGLILIFLALHTIGAHHTYAKVPAGFWLGDWFHFGRNHYDRIIHLSFGLLLFYPMRELLQRSARAHRLGRRTWKWLRWPP